MPDRTQLDILKKDRGRLTAELEAAGATVTGTTVRCPFHEDTNPSGGIHELDGGQWAYTCHGCTWNGDTKSGDVVDVVKRAKKCDFRGACEHLRLSDAQVPATHLATTTQSQNTESLAANSHRRLLAEPDMLDHLWRSRGVNKAIATQFRLGITGTSGRRYWIMPITCRDGGLIAIKAHAADNQSSKSWWAPKGINRDHVWPIHINSTGPIWLCPGELKALAVISVGESAIGITSGEGTEKMPNDLPGQVVDLVRGRQVAIPPDDDPVGGVWGPHVQRQLSDAGIDARIVDLDLDRAAGLKDIGDWIVRRLIKDAKKPEAVAETLRDRYRRSDPWYGSQIGELWRSGAMWRAVTFIPTGLDALDEALGGGLRTRGTHLIVGKPGKCKTQLAVTLAIGAASKDVPTGFLSLELGRDEVAQLVAAQLGEIPRRVLALGKVTGAHLDSLKEAQRLHGNIPLYVLDEGRWPHGLNRERLSELIGDGVARFGWRCVVVDYMGLLTAPESDRSDFQTDLLNSAALRRIARKNDVALIVVAALRKSAGFKNPTGDSITLDDVAGAGRIAYDAQTVLFVNSQTDDADSGLVHVRPLKLRFAPMTDGADIQLRWNPSTGLIMDLPDD